MIIPPRPRDEIELTTRDMKTIVAPAATTSAAIRIVVGVCAQAVDAALVRCLESIGAQSLAAELFGVVLLFDGLGLDEVARSVALPAQLRDRTWVLTGNCGSASRARNAVLEYVDTEIPGCRWVARLDCDDRLASSDALAAAFRIGEAERAVAVVGGNRVLARDGSLLRLNPARRALLDAPELLTLLEDMAQGRAFNEPPSCNLLLRAQSGIRYPDMSSAEDHWLVADLLLNRPGETAILEAPLFADYTLDGAVTLTARQQARYVEARQAIFAAASTWVRVRSLPGRILGLGQEAVVREHGGRVFKHFYPRILAAEKVAWLAEVLRSGGAIPSPEFEFDDGVGAWVASYPFEETTPFVDSDAGAVRRFLTECLSREIVCANIKRTNFRVRPSGELVYIDIGNWIVPMDVSVMRDASARLFSVGVLGGSDDEVLRRRSDHGRPEIWERLSGFAEFYGELVGGWIQAAWSRVALPRPRVAMERASDVTLLIKACAMDTPFARQQIIHITDQLACPREFAERVLLIDPFKGPFLRQHQVGDMPGLLDVARQLVASRVIDRVIVAPDGEREVREVNARWFGVDSGLSHSVDGVPVAPQVWAFEQVATRYVLQCDLDVLVGRRRREHDYLSEMVAACAPDDVVCVAFNIAQPAEQGPRPYDAPAGEYKPEVRLGLLDLDRLRAQRPLPARVEGGRLTTTWYRALHAAQRERGLRTVRGGHPDTFYVHPLNPRKSDPIALGRIRDLVAQGLVPDGQRGRWDLEAPDEDWRYPSRSEPVVVLARGRNTPPEKLDRFVAGLALQDDQTFGVIVIDDASDDVRPGRTAEALAWLGSRLTLVRNPVRAGRMPNNLLAVRRICTDPATMVLVVDLDDALAHPAAVREVRAMGELGHDVVLAAPFRADVPTKVYWPCFDRARETFGGDVWIHLRAFRKRVFDSIPERALQLDGDWVEEQDDYATMVPIVDRAESPIYLPRYRYWHERSTQLDDAGKRLRDRTIMRIVANTGGSEVKS